MKGYICSLYEHWEINAREEKKNQSLRVIITKEKNNQPGVALDWKLKTIANHQKNVFLKYSSSGNSGTNPDKFQMESACVTCMSNPVNKQEYKI